MNRFTPAEILICSFALAIFTGAILLSLPFSLRGNPITFLDALFTSASAICVTGLTVKNTGSYFSLAGQCVIMTLIQLGGFGILTFGVFMLHQMGWAISLRSKEAVSMTYPPGAKIPLRLLLRDTLRLTLLIESVGAVILGARFLMKGVDIRDALLLGVFHSISAFCNAGFSLFDNGFIDYQGDLVVNVVLMALIVTGGIGFFVLRDIKENLLSGRRSPHPQKSWSQRLTIHSRVVLLSSSALVFFGACSFYVLERAHSLADKSPTVQVLCSLFQSVSARTAGFNTLDIGSLANPTIFMLILLMFIGASPGSTGGGIKVTSFATLMLILYNRMRGRLQVECFRRALSIDVVHKTVTLFTLSVCFVSLCVVLLLTFEMKGVAYVQDRGSFLELLFEAVSAFGTVGLSTGVTSTLSPWSKGVLILLMFIGRLGPLTLVALLEERTRDRGYRLPEERIMIG